MKKLKFCIILLSVLLPLALSSMPAHSTDNEKKQPYQVHTVEAGDSLLKIAKQYYDDYSMVARIAEFNDIKDINKLNIGQKIKILVLASQPSKKASKLNEADLGGSKQGESDALEETTLNKGLDYPRLDRGAVFFILVYLIILLSLILIKWKDMADDYHPRKPEVDVRRFSRRKWRM